MRGTSVYRVVAGIAACIVFLAACSSGESDEAAIEESSTTSESAPSPTTTAPPTTPATTQPTSAMYLDGDVWQIDQSQFVPSYDLDLSPRCSGYGCENNQVEERWHTVQRINLSGGYIGLFMRPSPVSVDYCSLGECYTIWTGGLGENELECKGSYSGMVCLVVFTPDGENLNADASASGVADIIRLDDDGYEVVVNATFTDGTRIEDLRLTGSTPAAVHELPIAFMERPDIWRIDWSTLTPAYSIEGTADAPIYTIFNNPAADRMEFTLVLSTTDADGPWPGGLGTFPLTCTPDRKGICLTFAPPGAVDQNPGFAGTGTVTINQLDEDGYDVVINANFPNGLRMLDGRFRGQATAG